MHLGLGLNSVREYLKSAPKNKTKNVHTRPKNGAPARPKYGVRTPARGAPSMTQLYITQHILPLLEEGQLTKKRSKLRKVTRLATTPEVSGGYQVHGVTCDLCARLGGQDCVACGVRVT